MNPTKEQFLDMMEQIAPRAYAESFDNVGLLIDVGVDTIRRVLLALDLTEVVAREAVEVGCDLVLTHHPIFFSPVQRLSVHDPTQAAAMILLRNGISHLAAHTNFDSAPEGMNVQICELLELEDHRALEPKKQAAYKIVTFVPASHAAAVRDAMAAAGAGKQGAYSHCSFSVEGEGRFRPLEGAKPYLGQTRMTEIVPEVRIECLALQKDCANVLAAIRASHPYEEPACDVFLEAEGMVDDRTGLTRMGRLHSSATLKNFAETVKRTFGSAAVLFSGEPDRTVRTVAVSSGAGGGSWELAHRAGADVLVTGEAKYNQVLDASACGVSIVQAGHYETERIGMQGMCRGLQSRANQLQWGCEFLLSERETSPMHGV